jgi:hypothetical protein
VNKPKTVSKINLSKWFHSCVDQAAKSGDWTGYDPDCEYAIYHLIANMDKKVSKKQLSIWADRIMSEVEIVGYVPKWILRDIFETLGHEVEEEER